MTPRGSEPKIPQGGAKWGLGGRNPSNWGQVFFQGTNELNLDAKGRLAIPAKIRERLGEAVPYRVVVTISPQDSCLFLYPESEWFDIARTVTRLPSLVEQNKRLQRLLLGNAAEMELDGQGRILLSAALRAHAGLDKRVALVGQGNKFEIWDDAAWSETMTGLVDEAKQLGSELSAGLQELSL